MANGGTSTNLPVSDAELETMLEGRRAVRRVHFEPLKREIGIRALSDYEIDQAKLEAQRYCKRVGADIDMDPDFLEREKERQFVWRSVVEPEEPHRPLFGSDEIVRKSLDSALVRAFFNAYIDVLDELTPVIRLTEEEVSELVDSMGKEHAPQAVALRHYAHDTLRSLVRIMAVRLYERT